MSRRRVASESSRSRTSSGTRSGSASTAAGDPGAGARSGAVPGPSGSVGTRPRSRTFRRASPVSGSPRPIASRVAVRVPGEARRAATSTNSRPPASCMGGRAVSCQTERAQGPHRVRHHLLVAHGDVHVCLPVVDGGDREQRGDRPALHDVEHVVVGQAPLDVLGATEVRLDPPAQPGQVQHLRIGQDRSPGLLRVDRHLAGPAGRDGAGRHRLGADRSGDDLAVAHRVDVGIDLPGDQGLAEAERRFDEGGPPVSGHGVRGEEDARTGRRHQPLDEHRHPDRSLVQAVANAVGDRPIGVERRPAAADVAEDRRRPDDVEERVLLAGGRRRGQVLGGGARADRARDPVAECSDRRADLVRQTRGDGHRFDGASDRRAPVADGPVVVAIQLRQLVDLPGDRRSLPDDLCVGIGGHAEPDRHLDVREAHELAERGALAAHQVHLRPTDLLQPRHLDHRLSPPSWALRRAPSSSREAAIPACRKPPAPPYPGHGGRGGAGPVRRRRRRTSLPSAVGMARPVPRLLRVQAKSAVGSTGHVVRGGP